MLASQFCACNYCRRGFERYLRKLLKLPQWPALLYLHVWQSAYMGPKFWTGGEMQIESILQYYSVPTVSARNALYELAARNATGFSEEEVHCGVHPNPLGHRCLFRLPECCHETPPECSPVRQATTCQGHGPVGCMPTFGTKCMPISQARDGLRVVAVRNGSCLHAGKLDP